MREWINISGNGNFVPREVRLKLREVQRGGIATWHFLTVAAVWSGVA